MFILPFKINFICKPFHVIFVTYEQLNPRYIMYVKDITNNRLVELI